MSRAPPTSCPFHPFRPSSSRCGSRLRVETEVNEDFSVIKSVEAAYLTRCEANLRRDAFFCVHLLRDKTSYDPPTRAPGEKKSFSKFINDSI
jgi:hypothetical protein